MLSVSSSIKKPESKFDQIKILYDFLAEGKIPDGIFIKSAPKMGKIKAFNVIYFLQEYLGIISDRYEQCCHCRELYDSYEEGEYIERIGRHYCEACRPDI